MSRTWMLPAVIVAAAAALVAAACYTPPANVASRFVKSVHVDSAQGAVITVTADESPELAGTTLSIDANALPADTTITLELGFDPIVGGQATPAGPVAIFGPPGTVFSTPARLTLPVALSSPQKESDLFIQVLEENGDRAEIPREFLEFAGGAASFRVNGFTSFQPGTNAKPQQDGGASDGGNCTLPCPSTHLCIGGACVCNSPLCADAGTACVSHSDCPQTDLCINQICQTCTGGACGGMCANNSHCQSGRVCVGGQCILATDGGNQDAGSGSTCDPIQQNCNTVGEYCYVEDRSQFFHTACATPTGTQSNGQTCQAQTDCFTTTPTSMSMYCVGLNPTGGSGVCRAFCDLNVANNGSCSQVPVPQVCVPIIGGVSGPGYCDPV